jgi:formylglycine-generating enzyme required for sulfatase activity
MVTGGTYYRTYDLTDAGTPLSPGDGGPVGEADPATVSNFRLDKYLVTVGRFRQFVNAVLPPDGGAGWLPAAATGKHAHLNGGKGLLNVGGDGGVAYEPGWVAADDSQLAPTTANLSCDPNYATWTGAPGSNENLPIDCVNWWESYAFCIWDGGFLPSEAEWEYAAAGGSQQREYPWGSTDPGMGSQYAIYGCFFDATGSCTSTMNIAPVGTTTLGAGLWGQLDLAGEFWEWNLDWAAPYVDPCVDCANVTVASFRGLRGGDFTIDPSEMYSSFRSNVAYPKARSNYNGLRCARAP